MKETDRNAVFSAKSDEHITPPDLFKKLNNFFHFELDPCSTPYNPLKTDVFWYNSPDSIDALKSHWDWNTFVNPPYSDVYTWTKKTLEQSRQYPYNIYVMLLPSRTDRPFFQELVFPHFESITFISGRLRFYYQDPDKPKKLIKSKYQAPFPSCIVTFGRLLTNDEMSVLKHWIIEGKTIFNRDYYKIEALKQ